MFSLIVTVVAVALVAALGLATFYYGGTAFKDHSTKAKAAQVVMEGQQISAAVDLYRAKNNALPPTLDTLTLNGEYLSSRPNSSWSFSTDYVVYPMSDIEACKKANKVLGLDLADIPLCSAVTGKTICCQMD